MPLYGFFSRKAAEAKGSVTTFKNLLGGNVHTTCVQEFSPELGKVQRMHKLKEDYKYPDVFEVCQVVAYVRTETLPTNDPEWIKKFERKCAMAYREPVQILTIHNRGILIKSNLC